MSHDIKDFISIQFDKSDVQALKIIYFYDIYTQIVKIDFTIDIAVHFCEERQKVIQWMHLIVHVPSLHSGFNFCIFQAQFYISHICWY